MIATIFASKKSLVLGVVFMYVALWGTASAQTVPITGWAWSDTIGWISLNCNDVGTCATVPYGLEKSADGTVTGYAWSEHIGWISAQSADLVGCPLGICSAYVSTSGLATGWLRALSAGGGWDGWLSLRDSGYGVSQNAEGLHGWAWGSDVLGWVLFAAHLPCAAEAGPFCDGNALKYKDGECTITTLVADRGASGCSTITNQCVVPIPPRSVLPGGAIIKATPKVVQYGKSSVLTWDVVNAGSCLIQGNGNTWTSMSGSFVTNPINDGGATYTLYCTGPGGALEGKVRITNPPKVREL